MLKVKHFGIHSDTKGNHWLITDQYNGRARPLTPMTEWETFTGSAIMNSGCQLLPGEPVAPPGTFGPGVKRAFAHLEELLPIPGSGRLLNPVWVLDVTDAPDWRLWISALTLSRVPFPLWTFGTDSAAKAILCNNNMAPVIVDMIRDADQVQVGELLKSHQQMGLTPLVLTHDRQRSPNLLFPSRTQPLSYTAKTLVRVLKDEFRNPATLQVNVWMLIARYYRKLFELQQFADPEQLPTAVQRLRATPWDQPPLEELLQGGGSLTPE